MLVLARYEDETIWLDRKIKIMIVQSGKQVKVGIDAPKEVEILRGEHLEQMELKDENRK